VGNPPYIRWDAIPGSLRDSYKARFVSFKQRADHYVAFIEHALSLLDQHGQLGFLCPGTWTRNVYGGAVREAFTTLGSPLEWQRPSRICCGIRDMMGPIPARTKIDCMFRLMSAGFAGPHVSSTMIGTMLRPDHACESGNELCTALRTLTDQ
jgi:hypothetical protein